MLAVGTAFARFGRGFADGAIGFAYLARTPRLWLRAAWPAIIALVVLGAIAGAAFAIAAIAGRVLPSEWAHPLRAAIHHGAWTVLTLGLFVAVVSAISGPFNELLSARVETVRYGIAPPPLSVTAYARDVAVAVVHSLRRRLEYVAAILALAVIAWVPVVGDALAFAGLAVVAARFAAYRAYDSVWGRKRWAYAAKMAYLREHRARSLGLGAFVALMWLVPGVNLFALAIGTTGATIALADADAVTRPSRSARPTSS